MAPTLPPRRINPGRQAKAVANRRIQRIHLKRGTRCPKIIPRRRSGLRPRVRGGRVVRIGGGHVRGRMNESSLLFSLRRCKDTRGGRGAKALSLGRRLLCQDRRGRRPRRPPGRRYRA